jgi:hypothetical protein
VIDVLQEVIFKLGSVHVVICFQHYYFERLVHIDPVGVDTAEFIMRARYLGCIHCVVACWNDGDGARIEGFHPRRC